MFICISFVSPRESAQSRWVPRSSHSVCASPRTVPVCSYCVSEYSILLFSYIAQPHCPTPFQGLFDAFSCISNLPKEAELFHAILFADCALVSLSNIFFGFATFKSGCWAAGHQKRWLCVVQQHAPSPFLTLAPHLSSPWWVSSREWFSDGLTSWIGLPCGLMWCKRGCGPAGPGVREGKLDHPSQSSKLTQSH